MLISVSILSSVEFIRPQHAAVLLGMLEDHVCVCPCGSGVLTIHHETLAVCNPRHVVQEDYGEFVTNRHEWAVCL